MPSQTPYERQMIKAHRWDGQERRHHGILAFSPRATRYRDRVFFYKMLFLAIFTISLVLAWWAFIQA